MNILFICTANKDRSRTAEIYFSNMGDIVDHHQFRSAGINKYLSERHGGIHVKKYMLEIADLIYCMEKCHSDYIVNQIDKKYLAKIHVLNLGDTERFMSPQLIKMLDDKFKLEKL